VPFAAASGGIIAPVMQTPSRALKRLLTKPLRLPRLRPYVPQPDDPPVFAFNAERADIVREVVRRMEDRCVEEKLALEYVLNEVAYEEIRRLEAQRDDEAEESLGFWKGTVRRLGKMSEHERRDTFRAIAERMAKDVAGNFDPRVYAIATRVVPHLLTGIMKPGSLPQDLAHLGSGHIPVDDLLRTEGSTDQLRKLAKKGTLVFVPTHSSNLDSVALGYALMRENLPPVVYGAGKNLFTNPIISFFMHNLGAYRVDRRIRAALYKDVLKTYSTVMIERGYHSLFFPGGTRSRSGMVEKRLKLGLAGTAVEAFARNRTRGLHRPVFFVPTTINYGLVLEAETLIEDWLKEAGRARYIIDDDEFSQLERWVAFFRKLAAVESACVIRFGDPIDPFGNRVDDEGRSRAVDGRTIDAGSYVMKRGIACLDPRRDAAYTRELGQTIADAYERETVLMATQVVAHVMFRRLVRETPGVDLFGRLRHRGEVGMRRDELHQELGVVLERLRAMADRGEVHLSERTRTWQPAAIVDRVIQAFVGYHRKTILTEQDGMVVVEDPTLCLYYQNRLNAYAERIADDAHLPQAREIARIG
jgi:glycerol-3-phosphate O-acyltransferase